jgi:hypothetical protein
VVFLGSKGRLWLGASIGATLGVIYVGSVFGMAGNPQGAMIGAFAGGLLGMVFLLIQVTHSFIGSLSKQPRWCALKQDGVLSSNSLLTP